MGRIPEKPSKERITYYARPEVMRILEELVNNGKFKNRSDVISAAILEYSHRDEQAQIQDLEEKYRQFEERIQQMEEKYASLITVLSSVDADDTAKTTPLHTTREKQ